jgi:hypothetical protein
MEATPEGAWRSFLAAAICLPAFLALQFFAWGVSGPPAGGLARALAAELTGYAAAWAGFALVSLAVARSWDREGHWLRFICAWNWTNVVQYLVLLALVVPGGLGVAGWLAQGLVLAGLGYAIWLEWFVIRHALAVEGWRAASLVAVDLFIALAIGRLVEDLSRGMS